MSLIIILATLALILGSTIIAIKVAKFVAEKGESLTKIILVLVLILGALSAVAYVWPDLMPQLTKVCNGVAEAIKGLYRPYVG